MQSCGIAIFATLIACLCSTVSAANDSAGLSAGSGKPPAPNTAALHVATKNIKEIYGKRIAQAHDQSGKLALCAELIKVGNEESDPGNHFAILVLARDTAAGAGALEMSFRAIDAINATFQVDGLRMKADAALTASRLINSTADARAFVNESLPVLEQAVEADHFDFVRELGNEILAVARKAESPMLLQQATVQSQRATEAAKAYLDVKRSLTTLTQNPKDPAANLKVGKFRCFVHDDWDHGLPLLALGSDRTLKDIAQMELAQPTGSDEQLKLGDAWWGLAGSEKSDLKSKYQARAAKWYEAALPQLTGLRQLSIAKHLKEIQAVRDASDPLAGVEMIRSVKGTNARVEKGVVFIKDPGRIQTPESFQPPIDFRVVVQTDSTNIRIAYACGQMIFNWEDNPDELRLDGGPADGRHQGGAGRVPVKQWVTIDMKVLPDSLTVFVDGKQRYQTAADFSKVSMPFAIFPAAGSTIQVRSILARRP